MDIVKTALTLPCSKCDAVPRQWCLSLSGNRATYLHSARTRLIESVFSEGYRKGFDDAKDRYVTPVVAATRKER